MFLGIRLRGICLQLASRGLLLVVTPSLPLPGVRVDLRPQAYCCF